LIDTDLVPKPKWHLPI